jgi:hypothetical protein
VAAYQRDSKTPDKLDADDRLILVRVKVERAKQHLEQLAAEILAVEYTHILPPDPKTGVPPNPIVLLHPNRYRKVPTFSVDVLTLAGDIIHNLRSALDHLAQQLVAVGLVINPPPVPLTRREFKRLGFPIAETRKEYKSLKRSKVKGMLPKAVKAIDALKPYKRGNPALWRIHELDIIDKHRALLLVGPHSLFTAKWLGTGAYMLKTHKPHFAGVETQVEKDIQLEAKKAISKTKIPKPNTILKSLHQLVEFVDNLVLSFKPLLE